MLPKYFRLGPSSKASYLPIAGSIDEATATEHYGSGGIASKSRAATSQRSATSRWHIGSTLPLAIGLSVGALLGGFLTTHGEQIRANAYGASHPTGPNQFAPQVPLVKVVFKKNEALMDPPSDISQKAWDNLTPPGHGFVNISSWQDYGLQPGIPTEAGVDRYSVAMFHQLHCLGSLQRKFWHLLDKLGSSSTDIERQEEIDLQLQDNHFQHCFAYLAESIWCSADLTIEWARVGSDGSRADVDGWDIPHQCKDPDTIWAWMNENHGPTRDDKSHIHGG